MLKEEGSGAPAALLVHMHHFEAALARVQPSVSPRDQLMYESLRQKLRRCVSILDGLVSECDGFEVACIS